MSRAHVHPRPIVAALLALLLSPALASAAGRGPARPGAELWLHVAVDGSSPSGERVRINLPLSFVETAVRLVPAEEMRGGRIVIEDTDLTVAELRELWRSLDAAGDAVLVEAEGTDGRVTARRRGGYLVVETSERRGHGSRVEARIPETVIEALLSGNENELDLAAGLRALAANGAGELVTVDDHDSRVRVWVDASAEPRPEASRR